ncbi:p-loop containing nucleoside triphosphate hydrolase protein [Venturia nashicola]|nr:p-loop containing nucleoside triphosphate hydrolase protein [Venturia nashicola]
MNDYRDTLPSAVHIEEQTSSSSFSDTINTPSTLSSTDNEDGHSKHKEAAKWVKEKTKVAKTKTKQILHINRTDQQLHDGPSDISEKIQSDPGFNPDAAVNAESSTLGQIKDQLPDNRHDWKQLIRNPQKATQNKAERTLATSEEPYLSRSDDDEFLRTHEKLEQQTAALPDDDFRNDQHQAMTRKKLDELEDSRESKKVAWILSRYVHRARVLAPAEHSKFPVLATCRWGKMKWNRDLLLQETERIVMASSTLQKRLSRLRRLWQWEQPRRSAAWFAIWLFVWYNNLVFTCVFCVLGYTIARTRGQIERVQMLKESHDRIGDENATPDTFGELIYRHGSSDWMDPMIENIGPIIQPSIKLLADWMESFANFYEWKTTRATTVLLLLTGLAIAIANFLSAEIILRISTLAIIVGFFVDRPISWRAPNYYSVVAPMHWVFWDIPTHIESSFKYLRGEAEKMRADAFNTDPSISGAPSQDIFTTSCKWNDVTGSITVTFGSIRFTRRLTDEVLWEHPFTALHELQKGDGKTAIVKRKENFLDLRFKSGVVVKVEKLEQKDELFNVIVAFSGLTWKQVDP